MLDGPRWGPRQGRAEQLVVLCHGVGADGHDLIDLAPSGRRRCRTRPSPPPTRPSPMTARRWAGNGSRSGTARRRSWPPAPMRRRALLGAFVDAELARLGLPADAYALMGFSQGAMTALHAGLRRAVPPRAILAFSGALLAPERWRRPTPRPPVLLVHGEADEVVPAARSREAEQALREAGFAVESLFSPAARPRHRRGRACRPAHCSCSARFAGWRHDSGAKPAPRGLRRGRGDAISPTVTRRRTISGGSFA